MEILKKSIQNSGDKYTPEFFRLSDSSSKLSLEVLLSENPHISITDDIEGQVRELVKSRHPKGLEEDTLNQHVLSTFGGNPTDEYGVWVFYPWNNKLVHILDEAEFIELRTNRNQNKITVEERDVLASKSIGIIGLSVGQSIALTLTMERGCGELRLADFDRIELSNLNRIRTPLYNIGTYKVVATAREIAEIDPFIKVKIFTDGVTQENMKEFMLDGGKLDLLVDECDGLDMKIQAREFAKTHRIPVIMDTSDRGMLDVERFDLHPDLPLLHGLVEGIDSNSLKGLTNEEKIPFVLRILDFEKLSNRAKMSLMEVKKTISTWPQLASSVVLGGAVGADVSRRILLGQFTDSGRYYVDLEELISNKIE
jgi:molybdopterin/thiamine biosynthesis adenylyltransferase